MAPQRHRRVLVTLSPMTEAAVKTAQTSDVWVVGDANFPVRSPAGTSTS
jgi:hypothetical protein